MADIAFRRLVADVCDRLTSHDLRRIVYIRLYSKRYQLKDADGFDVFDALECANVFSPSAPEGLLEVIELTGNKQIANTVKDFIKKKEKSPSGKRPAAALQPPAPPEETDTQTDSVHLRMCYKVVQGQVNVLLQQIEVIRQAVWAGSQDEDGKYRAHMALEKISKTASDLVENLQDARRQSGLLSRSNSGSSTDSNPSGSDIKYELNPTPSYNVKAKVPPPPPPKPKTARSPVHATQQETHQDYPQGSSVIVCSSTGLHHQGMELRQPQALPGTQLRPNIPVRYTRATPISQVKQDKPIPKPRPPARTPSTGGKQQQTDDSLIEENEYHMLEPFLEHEGSADSGVGASGSGDGEFTDVKRYAKQPIPSTKTTKSTQYKSLNRNTMEELLEYTSRSRQEMDQTLHMT